MTKFFFFLLLSFGSIVLPLNAMEKKRDDQRIRQFTIAHLESMLPIMDKERKISPQARFQGISDWDLTLAGLADVDERRLHRQHNTKAIFDSWKDRMPVFVATARRRLDFSLEQYKDFATNMETNMDLFVSDQSEYRDLVIDLRQQSGINRGVFVRGIYFSGSSKGRMTGLLLDQHLLPESDHYFFVDDDPKYINQMIELFRTRKEKLTVFHYPNYLENEADHAPFITELGLLHPKRQLSFLLRHGHKKHIETLLQNPEFVDEVKAGDQGSLFIDLFTCKHSHVTAYVMTTLSLSLDLLTPEEKMLFCDKLIQNLQQVTNTSDKTQ